MSSRPLGANLICLLFNLIQLTLVVTYFLEVEFFEAGQDLRNQNSLRLKKAKLG